jgi:hypothetical protein
MCQHARNGRLRRGCGGQKRRDAEQRGTSGESHMMDFDLLDRYLLDESVKKSEVVAHLLKNRPHAEGAAPFYQGLELLGAKAPDLTLIALRLVLAGKKADDESVIRMRAIVDRARAKGVDAAAARGNYFKELS